MTTMEDAVQGVRSNQALHCALPTLYAVTSTGDIKEWTVSAHQSNGTAVLRKVFGRHGGTLQVNDKEIAGKNIGRANETTPFQQACAMAESDWKKKKDKNYVEHVPDANDPAPNILPMLAHPYKDRAHDIVWPAYVQPKLNGVRCLAHKVSDTEIRFTSRKGKSYDDVCAHLKGPLLELMTAGEILDGELYNHDWSFQNILRHTKKARSDQELLGYWVYDVADETVPFKARTTLLYLKKWTASAHPVVRLNTVLISSKDQLMDWHAAFVADGFEGVIVRNLGGRYKFGHRSADLQKYKEFIDEEFPIIGGKAAEGSQEGCVIFRVKVADGIECDVSPRGSLEYKRRLFRELDTLIGKPLTVRYQERSEDGNLVFPVGIAIRDYE